MDGQATTFTGGLYPGGSNTRPSAHEAAGRAAAARITHLTADGMPDPRRGRIVMVSIGMSNTNSEFDAFSQQARADSAFNPRVILVNGALGGQTAEYWSDPNARNWQLLNDQLVNFQLSPQQVQVAWVKLTLTRGGEFSAKALELQAHLEGVARSLKTHFPNLQIAFFSSRTRSYTYVRGLSPEPLAFETGFSVKWMIEKQINGDASLNYDPGRGEVRAPYLSWGPYLWADGQNPRSDGFTWQREDMTNDCTHPSYSGREKVGGLLLHFFKNDTLTRDWFIAGPLSQQPTPTTGPSGTATPRPPVATPTDPHRPPAGDPNRPHQLFLAIILGISGVGTSWILLRGKRA
jgi:hypothetical protein